MEWVEIRRAKRRDQEKQRDAQILAQAEAKVINALHALQEDSKESLTLEQALEEYESQSGKKT